MSDDSANIVPFHRRKRQGGSEREILLWISVPRPRPRELIRCHPEMSEFGRVHFRRGGAWIVAPGVQAALTPSRRCYNCPSGTRVRGSFGPSSIQNTVLSPVGVRALYEHDQPPGGIERTMAELAGRRAPRR